MRLRDFNFNTLKSGNPNPQDREGCIGLCVIDGEKEYMGFIAEVLEKILHLADREIDSTNINWYFNTFIIRLQPEGAEQLPKLQNEDVANVGRLIWDKSVADLDAAVSVENGEWLIEYVDKYLIKKYGDKKPETRIFAPIPELYASTKYEGNVVTVTFCDYEFEGSKGLEVPEFKLEDSHKMTREQRQAREAFFTIFRAVCNKTPQGRAFKKKIEQEMSRELTIKFAIIEKALGIELYEWQKDYLLENGTLQGGRGSGKTTAYIIKLALSEGDPIKITKLHEYADMFPNQHYARFWFKNEFLQIWEKLYKARLPVRKIAFRTGVLPQEK
jgi:hypothetical protein